MHEILCTTQYLPVLTNAARYANPQAFYHADRTIPFNVLIYVIKGQIFVTEDDIDYEINPGEMLFLKSNVHHYGKKQIKAGTLWIFVHFYMELPTSDARPFTLNEPVLPKIPEEKEMYFTKIPKKLCGLKNSLIEKKLENLIDYVHSREPARKLFVNVKLYELLCDCALTGYSAPDRKTELPEKIIVYLDEHVYEPFSSEALESQFFLTYKHMETVFKKEKGMTPLQYHTGLRIQTACGLLGSTLFSIREISDKMGYPDALYFSRIFKKQMGISPREYRRRLPYFV